MKDFIIPKEAPLNVKVDAGLPLPPDVILAYISVFEERKSKIAGYNYLTELKEEEIVAFYQALQPTNGSIG